MSWNGRRWLWAVTLGTALVGVACGEKESGFDDEHGPLAPTASTPAPTPAPSATPSPGTSPSPAPSPTPAPTVTVAYQQDVKPILDQDCASCHGSLGSYQGVMGLVRAGDPSCTLVRVTQLGGSMYGHLSGDRAARSDLIRRWVVDNGAAQSR